MNQKSLLLFVLVVFLFSCEKKKEQPKTDVEENEKYLSQRDEVVEFFNGKEIKVVFQDSIKDWKGYYRVQEDLTKFKKNSVNEVLSLSEKLVDDVVVMRDSIKERELRDKGMKARINVMYNQALRLQEMKSIPAITVEEVTKQTQGLFAINRMINEKINAIYEKQEFEKDLKDDNFFFSKIDSLK